MFTGFPKEGLDFLRGIKRNNRREWFLPRKHIFENHVKAPMVELVEALNTQLARLAPEHMNDPKQIGRAHV